jgi:hypothetical protein
MKSLEEFRAFCNGNLKELLLDLDKQKNGVNMKILFAVLSLAAAILSGIYITPFLSLAFVIAMVVFIILAVKAYKKFHLQFKEKLIQSVVKFIDNDLRYDHKGYISETDFRYSNIYKQSPDEYSGDDYVYGTIGKTRIQFSEVHVVSITETERDGRTERTRNTIFKGLLFIADFNKNFRGETYVLTDYAEKFFGAMGSKLQSMNITRPPLVKLEDPEFEKCFVVHGTDQVESRYILSTSLMQRILQLKKKTKCNVQMSFKGSYIYITIPMRKNFLAPPVFGSLLNNKNVEEYFEDVKMMIEIVEDLNLNTRIWGKD